jgi:hypothetical protein
MSNSELAAVAASLHEIAFRTHERAGNGCKAGMPGLRRNSVACTRTLADARYLIAVADCLGLT